MNQHDPHEPTLEFGSTAGAERVPSSQPLSVSSLLRDAIDQMARAYLPTAQEQMAALGTLAGTVMPGNDGRLAGMAAGIPSGEELLAKAARSLARQVEALPVLLAAGIPQLPPSPVQSAESIRAVLEASTKPPAQTPTVIEIRLQGEVAASCPHDCPTCRHLEH